MSVKFSITARQVVCVHMLVLTPQVVIAVRAQLATKWAETAEAAEVSQTICTVYAKQMYVNLRVCFAYAHVHSVLHVDIDECATRQNNCTRDRLCINTYGGFQCIKVECPRIPNVTYIKTSPT